MSIVVEDGTGKADAQSYASLATADSYHTLRGNSDWAGTDTEKEAALVRATDWIDARLFSRWPGLRYSTTQALEWPRAEAYDQDGNDISSTVPAALVKALCEAALIELSDARVLTNPQNENGAIISETEGGVSKTYARGAPAVPPAVIGPLYRLLRPVGLKVVRG